MMLERTYLDFCCPGYPSAARNRAREPLTTADPAENPNADFSGKPLRYVLKRVTVLFIQSLISLRS
jgi:hypothetical protein